MTDIAICAACGEEKGLCGSARVDGIQQPRICKECLLKGMNTGDYGISDIYWMTQIAQLNDQESIDNLRRMAKMYCEAGHQVSAPEDSGVDYFIWPGRPTCPKCGTPKMIVREICRADISCGYEHDR
jgi:hypothetical protein